MIKTSFLITHDINHIVILGTPVINLITPYTVDHDDISFKYFQHNLLFSFIDQPHTRELNTISKLQKPLMSDFLIAEFLAGLQKPPVAPKKKDKEVLEKESKTTSSKHSATSKQIKSW